MQCPFEDSLFNAPQLFYSSCLGYKLFLAPLLALMLVMIPSFWWFFPQPLVVSCHICIDQHSARFQGGPLHISGAFSLFSNFPTSIYLTNLSRFGLNEKCLLYSARDCQAWPGFYQLSPFNTPPQ